MMLRLGYVIATFCVWGIVGPSYLLAQDIEVDLEHYFRRQNFYSYRKLQPEFTPVRMQTLLQRFTDQVYGKGFRYFGDSRDFGHGHILFRLTGSTPDDILTPVVILYHTQEGAYLAEEGAIDSRYKYIDVRMRNWIQWLDVDASVDGARVENARSYLAGETKDRALFFEANKPQGLETFTIKSAHLDRALLGHDIVADQQFEFESVDCEKRNFYGYPIGPLSITVPGSAAFCFEVKSMGNIQDIREQRRKAIQNGINSRAGKENRTKS